jgi:hypothetical protein
MRESSKNGLSRLQKRLSRESTQRSKIQGCREKEAIMTEDERIKTAIAHTDTIRLTLHTIERVKMAASHGQTWDDVINNLLDVYYDDGKEKKKRGK